MRFRALRHRRTYLSYGRSEEDDMELNTCPSCRCACMDPWHYEAAMEAEEADEDPCGCIPRAAGA